MSGLITDIDGEPLAGAVVRIDGTSFACSANVEGKYQLKARLKKGDLIKVTFLGMNPVEVIYDGQSKLDFTLAPDSNSLDEVVVTAEPNINNIDIRARSGVVQTVDMKRLNEKPMTDISLALQGTVPGLIVTNTGELGSKPQIRIRGNQSLRVGDAANEPLFILDGKVISSDAFRTLNPQDIK
ncbi:carboxypeptidase-like regulatory domain-containing protein [Paramuribaculum intestinale]|nr:carboxypeptidase-like regulatory domain-containing protein [Paramuribaculum intestinale]